MSYREPGVTGVMTCASAACVSNAPGHAVSAIRARVAAATPGRWVDAIVVSAERNGWVGLQRFDSENPGDAAGDGSADDVVWLWHHADLTGVLRAGSPVAFHAVYDVLAVGSSRYGVLVVG